MTEESKEETTNLEDTAKAEITKIEGIVQAPVMDAEMAMQKVKMKAAHFHHMISNVGHYASIPIQDVENIMAEIAHLLGVVRAKL